MTQPLSERYRPSSFSEVIGQPKVITRIDFIRERAGLAGRAFTIIGKSGTGKTTIARLIAGEIADTLNVVELDAGKCSVSELDDIERHWATMGLGEKSGRAFIVNEYHRLSPAAVAQWLVMLERIPTHVVIVFTSTNEGNEFFDGKMDAGAFHSRCMPLELAQRDLAKPFAEHVAAIAEIEKLGTAPIEKIIRLVNDCKANLRAVFQAIESGALLA